MVPDDRSPAVVSSSRQGARFWAISGYLILLVDSQASLRENSLTYSFCDASEAAPPANQKEQKRASDNKGDITNNWTQNSNPFLVNGGLQNEWESDMGPGEPVPFWLIVACRMNENQTWGQGNQSFSG